MKLQSDFLNNQVKKQMNSLIDQHLESFKHNSNAEIKKVKNSIKEVQSQILNINNEQNIIKGDISIIKKTSTFDLQNKNEEIFSYLREITRIQ